MDQSRSTQNQAKILLKKEFARLDEKNSGRISLNDFLRVMEEQKQKFAEPS